MAVLLWRVVRKRPSSRAAGPESGEPERSVRARRGAAAPLWAVFGVVWGVLYFASVFRMVSCVFGVFQLGRWAGCRSRGRSRVPRKPRTGHAQGTAEPTESRKASSCAIQLASIDGVWLAFPGRNAFYILSSTVPPRPECSPLKMVVRSEQLFEQPRLWRAAGLQAIHPR